MHYLGNEGRGTVWEEIIINCPAHIQLLSMSATVANPDDLGFWITKVDCTVQHAYASTRWCDNDFSHSELGICRASLAFLERFALSMMLLSKKRCCMLSRRLHTHMHYSGWKVALSPHVLTCALKTGAQNVFAHAKAVVHPVVQCALQNLGVA